jgi:hypothetical protein
VNSMHSRGLLYSLIFSFGLLGCSGVEAPPELPATVAFSGSIKLDGKPMNGGLVTFVSTTDKGLNASGVVGADGKYSMMISLGKQEKSGAVPGKYKVVISRFVKPNGEPQDPKVPAEIPGRESLPAQYSVAGASRLTAEVPAAGGTADFDLKSK